MSRIATILTVIGGTLGFGLQASAAQPVPPTLSCQASLQQLGTQWDAVGFASLSKPAQARVAARDGRVAGGAEVTYLTNQLRLAAQDCAAGRDDAGLQRIAFIRAALTR